MQGGGRKERKECSVEQKSGKDWKKLASGAQRASKEIREKMEVTMEGLQTEAKKQLSTTETTQEGAAQIWWSEDLGKEASVWLLLCLGCWFLRRQKLSGFRGCAGFQRVAMPPLAFPWAPCRHSAATSMQGPH